MLTVLITGANGFIGHYLVKQLSPHYQLIANGKGESRLPLFNTRFFYQPLDFTDEQQVNEIVDRYVPDVIIHSGALSKPDECERNKEAAYTINVTGTEYLLKAAKRANSFFIFLSTDFVFSGEKGMYSEEDTPAPVNYYGQTKWEGEEAVKNYVFDWAIVRTVLVYGKPIPERHNLLSFVASSLQQNKPVNIVNDQVRTPTYVEDIASAIHQLIKKKKCGIFHVSGQDILTPYQMAIATARHLSLNDMLINKVTADSFREPARRPSKTGFVITKAKQELDFIPTSFADGLVKTFDRRNAFL